MAFLPYNHSLQLYARKLRNQTTEHENILWQYLRKKQILNIQFYRQKIIGDYIVDFFAPTVKLVIEIDGSQHFEAKGIEKDMARDLYLRGLGLNILRFDNSQIKKSLNSVLEEIYSYIEISLR